MNRRVLLALALLVPATAGAQEPRAPAVRAEATVAALRSHVESLEATNRDLASRLAQLEGVVGELRRFRERVLFAIEPELGALSGRIDALESAYAEHRHSYSNVPYGFAPAAAFEHCTDCLIPFVSQAKVGKSTTAMTGVPE